MNTKSCLEEGSDRGKFEINEEKLHSPTTLDGTELNERDNNCALLRDKKDTELKSIHNYAQRIKSFLGWELNPEEQELRNEYDEVKDETVGGLSLKKFSHSSENSEYAHEGKVDFLDETSNFEEVEGKKCENTINYSKNGANSNSDFVEDSAENFHQNSEDKVIQEKYCDENRQYIDKEIIEMDLENNNIVSSPSNGKSDKLEKYNVIIDSTYGNKDVASCSKNDILSEDSGSLHKSNILIPHEDLKINDSLTDNTENFDVIISSGISPEDAKSSESEMNDKNLCLTDSKNVMELNNCNLTVSTSCNLTSEIEDRNEHWGKCTNKSSENEYQKPDTIDEEVNSTFISDTDTTVEKEDAVELNSPCIYGLNTNSEENNSNLLFESIKDPSLTLDFEKANKTENSEIIVDEVITCGSEIDLFPGENKTENDNSQIIKIDIFGNRKNDERIENNKENDTDDLKSEDSLDLDEHFSLDMKKSLPPQYIKKIRRLSRDIVKNVIETARNSVHDLHGKISENSSIISPSEKIKIPDDAENSQESYVNQRKQWEDETSEFDPKALKENCDSNSDYKNGQIVDGKNMVDEDTICGFGCFHPRWIQKYATPRAFLVLFSIIGVIHGGYYTYVVSVLSTLEKRYAFKTKVSGVLLLADEITPLILGILVGYVGGKTHRPRMVAIGMFLSAACCFVSGLPYLFYGTSMHSSYLGDKHKIGLKFCGSGVNSTHCNIDEQPPTLTVIGIFLLASFLKGFATLSYYVIGFSYMDDIIKRKNSSMYFAIALALRLLGPLVGFLMSSGFLKYYENPLYDPGFGPDDPRWIGAWWMGFFLQGILLVIFTIPIALFPRRLPSQKKVEKIDAAASENGFKEILTGLISALKRLGKNPVFIVLIINTTMKIFGHFGHAIMLPKYMENQFRLSASQASLYSGATTIVCIILSTLLGGFLIWKFTPRIKVVLGGMIASEAILCIGYLILMIPRCQTSEMLHFGMNEEGLILNSVCNKNCDCSTSSFTPFCGPDGKTLYFSPCYAGCTEEVISLTSPKTNKQFSNCSCVDQQQFGGTITEGFCPDENCRSQTIFYLVILFFLVTISNLFTVAATMILLRSVHPSDKSVALGTFETFICLFGFIPFPVTFGALVDSACLVWEKSCGETGNCWFYDMDKYGYLLHGASALFCALSVVCLITLYFLSPRVRNLYIEEDEDDVQTKYVDIKLDTVSGSVTKL